MTSRSDFLRYLRAMPAPLRISALLFLAAGLADGVLAPFFALWAVRDAHVPIAFVGLLLGCYAAGELLATPLVGGLSDRLGRRPVLIASTLGVSFGFLALPFAHGMVMAALALLVIGSFESVLHPTAAAIVADILPQGALRRQYGFNRMASNIGDMLGPVIGALLVAWSLRAVFIGAAATVFVACMIVTLGLRETRHGAAGADDDDDFGALGAVFRDATLASVLVPVAAIEIVASWIEAILPLSALSGTFTPAGIGWLFAYAGLLGVVFQMPLLHLCRNVAPARMALIAGGILALTFSVLALFPTLPGFVAAATGIALTGMLLQPLAHATSMAMAPAHARGTYAAAFSVVHDLRDATGPALGTALFSLAAALPWFAGAVVTVAATSRLAVALNRRGRLV